MAISAVAVKLNSIQEYIFHSNRLKENIGASQITSFEIFHVCMKKALQEMFTDMNELVIDYHKKHEKVNNELLISSNENIKCEIADIGGGGALILFREKKTGFDFIKKFSKEILLSYPGLKASFAQIDFDLNNYVSEIKRLNQQVNKNKNEYFINTTIQKHGITADCPLSDDSAEFKNTEYNAIQFISSASLSKIQTANQSAKNDLLQLNGNDKYILTTDIEKLGQNDETSYIAIIHIDGNGIGARFSEIDSFIALREASKNIQRAATGSMEMLISDLINKFDSKAIQGIKLKKNKKGDKDILPIRPILAGGDDITFVCEGRLGIYLAENYIKYFVNTKIVPGACAGVAIVKTHFPFYKAYELAEELCREAKELCRTGNEETEHIDKSYLSYYYSATTFSGSLKQLRERTHKLVDGSSMYFGPYNIFDNSASDSISKLKDGIKYFQDEEKFPKNKTMRLRDVIAESVSAQILFIKQIAEIGKQLPDKGDSIWRNKENDPNPGVIKDNPQKYLYTPYFDQIELMDFYLNELL